MKKTQKEAATVLASAGVALSATACSSDKAVVTYKGGKTTKSQYHNKMKESQAGQSTFANMIVSDTLENQYGKDVTQKQVDKEYNKYKKQYGGQFDSTLEQNGMTAPTFKDNLKTNLSTEATLRHAKKIALTQEKKAWKNYQPEVITQHTLISGKSTAEDIIKQLKDGGDFKKLAEKYSTGTTTKNNTGKLPTFDSIDSALDSSFKTVAFKLEIGEITTAPVKTQCGYCVIKITKHPVEGTLREHGEQINNQVYQSMSEDQSVMRSTIATVLKRTDISIKNKDLKNVLSQYIPSDSLSK